MRRAITVPGDLRACVEFRPVRPEDTRERSTLSFYSTILRSWNSGRTLLKIIDEIRSDATRPL